MKQFEFSNKFILNKTDITHDDLSKVLDTITKKILIMPTFIFNTQEMSFGY